MEFRQYKRHLHATLGVAIPATLAFGIWLGARTQEAGVLESIAVFGAYCLTLIVGLARVDRALIPPTNKI